MTIEFRAAIAQAIEQARASDPMAATRTIQAALTGGSAGVCGQAPAREEPASPETSLRRKGPRLDPDAEIVEPNPAGDIPQTVSGYTPPRRPGLGAVIRMLREGRGRLGLEGFGTKFAPGPGPVPVIPEGARFEARRFSGPHGSRGYKLYVPSTGQATGLVVMLHGCKQNPDDFATGTGMNAQAEAAGLIVVYPHQTTGENASCCWNWFLPAHQTRAGGEPAIIAGLTREVMAEFEIDPRRVYAAGLSAGGAMAAVLGQTCPDLFSAIGVHSGLPHGAARDVVTAFAAMRGDAPTGVSQGHAGSDCRVIVFHGTADRVVHPDNAARIIDAALSHAGPMSERLEKGRSPDGAGYTRRVIAGADGRARFEDWMIDGAGHAWSGGDARGSYADPCGPDASGEMVRFFLAEG